MIDLYITSYEQQTDVLFQNLGDGRLRDSTGPARLLKFSRMLITWGCGFVDFDADGWLDIFTANGHLYPQVTRLSLDRSYNQGVSFYQNSSGVFENITPTAFPGTIPPVNGRGSASLDYDGDGDMDMVVNCIDSRPLLLENRGRQGNYLQVELEATSAQALGTRVVATKGARQWLRTPDGGSGYLSQNSATLHFGFGPLQSIDGITVYWPHRPPQEIEAPPLNQAIIVRP